MFAQSLIGQTIATYRLLQMLGQGGMGAVFLALDEHQSQVAIKVLLPSKYSLSETHTAFRTRFMREAHTMSLLQHQHIVPVLDYGQLDDVAYIVMPYLPGGTLSYRLMQGGSMALHEVSRYLRQLASALDFAHQQGIVHRDIKPANVLLDSEGDVSLTDFGIARFFEHDPGLFSTVPVSLTVTGEVFGTPSYMAPEIFNGELARPTTDIYALGVMIYQLVTGRVPFQGKGALDVGIKHLSEMPLSPRSLRPELPEPAEIALLHALAKSSAERFDSAGAFADAFSAGLKGRWTPATSSYSLRLASQKQIQPVLHSQHSEVSTDKSITGPARSSRNLKIIFAACIIVMVTFQVIVTGMVLGARNHSTALSTLSTDAYKVVARNQPVTQTPPGVTPTATPSPVTHASTHNSTAYNDPAAMLIAVSNNMLYALSKDSGTVIWHYTTVGMIVPQPVIAGNIVYLVTEKGYVYALSKGNGALLWSYAVHTHVSSPVTMQNGIITIYADNGNSYQLQANSGRLLAAISPTATPSPTPGTTPTPVITPTPGTTPTPQATPVTTPQPTPQSTPTPDVSPVATPDVTPVVTTSPSHTI